MKIKWRHRQHCEWPRQQHVLLYVIKWQMIRFQALWKTKSFVKVCLKFKLPLWTKGLLIHLSPLWQLPLWHFPRWHNFPVYPIQWSLYLSYINIHWILLIKITFWLYFNNDPNWPLDDLWPNFMNIPNVPSSKHHFFQVTSIFTQSYAYNAFIACR